MASSSRVPSPTGSAPGPEAAAVTAPFPWGWRPSVPSLLASEVSLLRLQGPDSLRFLHGQTSQAIELASPGQWLSTCCISPTARLRALAEVLVLSDGAWLVIREGDGEQVRQVLDRVLFPADAVALGALRPGLLLEPLPSAAELRDDTANGIAPARGWRPLEGAEGFWLEEQLLLLAGAAPSPEAGALEPAARELLARPRLEGAARERWRIQVGWPACPAEVNDDTNPFELGLAERVSLSKGCYVGQETLAKLATYDGVRQQLRRWFVAGPEGPAVGASLSSVGERAGRITSALALPDGAGWIGLALVRRGALEAQSLQVERQSGAPLELTITRPDRFVEPPVGAGAAGRSGG